MPTYAVTGASGHLGRLAVQELLARGVPASDVVAVVRTPSKAADLAERGVQAREADYSRPQTLGAALAGVDRLLLVSSSEAGQRVAHHTNAIEAVKTAGASRIVYTSMLNADDTTNPLAGEHQDSERALREAGVPFTLLRNGYYTENYTGQLGQYLQRGEILGAAGSGSISAATRQDYAAAAAAALLQDEEGNRTYELGGPAFDLPELARVISEVTGTPVTYRDLPVKEYASRLQGAGLDEESAHFVAALDASIAQGDLETSSQDLARLLGRPATPLTDVVRAARGGDPGGVQTRMATIGLIGAGLSRRFPKTAQEHDYPSKAHRRSSARRTANERTYSSAKDPASNNISRGWCRLMALTALTLFTASLLIVRNQRILAAYGTRQASDARRAAAGAAQYSPPSPQPRHHHGHIHARGPRQH